MAGFNRESGVGWDCIRYFGIENNKYQPTQAVKVLRFCPIFLPRDSGFGAFGEESVSLATPD